MRPLVATGKDGKLRTFYIACSTKREIHALRDGSRRETDVWDVTVYLSNPPKDSDSFFTAEAVRVDGMTVMSKEMHANGLVGLGIPEAVVSYLQQVTGARIISSAYRANAVIFDSEWQSESGHGVWLRMQRNGLANEVPGAFRYEYIGP